MLRTLAKVSAGGTTKRQLPHSGRSAILFACRRQSSRAPEAEGAKAVRESRKPLAGPRRLPTKRIGLYDPALEKDSCGVGLSVQMKSIASRQVNFTGNIGLPDLHRTSLFCL